MFGSTVLYYFSPTGGTKTVGEAFCGALACHTISVDLGRKNKKPEEIAADLVVVAAPVFGGRIPTIAAEKLSMLDGTGKRAVTLAVYGNRAYEDALLELNHVMTARGFQIVASGAFIAQHSVVPEVGANRPDAQDIAEIQAFAQKVLEKVQNHAVNEIMVPGNHPYKNAMAIPAQPISLPSCGQCGRCEEVCPADAISVEAESVVTSAEKCILCMACVAACPQQAQILPPPLQERMNQMLEPLKAVRRENEYFL